MRKKVKGYLQYYLSHEYHFILRYLNKISYGHSTLGEAENFNFASVYEQNGSRNRSGMSRESLNCYQNMLKSQRNW